MIKIKEIEENNLIQIERNKKGMPITLCISNGGQSAKNELYA